MNNSNLLDGIAIFVCVVKNNSFVKAAEQLGHTASHISKSINKLEQRLGVRLLQRTTRTLRLTAEGQSYFNQCEQIVQEATNVENLISGKQQSPQGKLSISCPVSFGLYFLRPMLVKFMNAYPKIQLDIDLNDKKVDLIAQGYDIAIRASNQLADSTLVSRRFMTSTSVTLASPAYLERFGHPQKPEELIHHQTLCYKNLKQPTIWHYRDPKGNDIQVNVTDKVTTNNPELELSLCKAGVGILQMPLFNLTDEVTSGQLVTLFEHYQSPEIGVFLVYPSRRNIPIKVQCFIDFILENIKTC